MQNTAAELAALVNTAIADQEVSRSPGKSTPSYPSIILRHPLNETERASFGDGATVPCWQGHEERVLYVHYMKEMLQRLHETAVRRDLRLDLEQLRQRALTVLTPNELNRLENYGRK